MIICLKVLLVDIINATTYESAKKSFSHSEKIK